MVVIAVEKNDFSSDINLFIIVKGPQGVKDPLFLKKLNKSFRL